ncbi:MAG: NAD(P)(+) transhydrogenase (Re/Si-specific) subunit beta [Porticoccaceae bacterium]|jgi:NAD(P) transhydrogenase subunit beta|nr:NAD(P)(+) transhydrogenase (Re/Si-specific) subunit beta [Porticoccaceae bacterium]HLS98856.1 NAD(P)(+) transhydrogenase (Re/Si-specific) subunit beta [Porticoccaceae bacterium]
MNITVVNLIYLAAAVLFILGIKGLGKPKTAVRGNLMSAAGMFIAVVVTLFDRSIVSYEYIIAGVVIGSLVGAIIAIKVQMTSMPQMVAILNGFGGGSSLAIALAEYYAKTHIPAGAAAELMAAPFGDGIMGLIAVLAISLTILIGAVTLTGSFVAFAKLQELMKKDYGLPGGPVGNGLLLLVALVAVGALCVEPTNATLITVIVIAALLLGLFLVLPIGGADMPVVIALLNSYSGIAGAFAGFILGNTVLIVAGSLVGTSGLILTKIMCVAMNRSLANVLFGKMAGGGVTVSADEVYGGKVKSAQADEVAMMLETAKRVVIVPGFGMAMAQAQHAVRELMDVLEARGTEVEFAIHPVAGRMPGHMNVLLAEAEVPYEKLIEMERINPTFEETDIAIVIGANDVTNPMAREDKGSPIYGMPILNVDKAKTVIVVKRSLSPGFAGLPNPLFAMDHTYMVYGDGKKAIIEMTTALGSA